MAKSKMTYKVYFSDSGIPTTGLTPIWKNDQWIRVSDRKKVNRDDPTDWDATTGRGIPEIKEAKGGWYCFDSTPAYDIVAVIDGGSSLQIETDRYIPVALGPQDTNLLERSVSDFYNLLKREFENQKVLTKLSGLQYKEELFNDGASAVIRTRNITKSGSIETRESP